MAPLPSVSMRNVQSSPDNPFPESDAAASEATSDLPEEDQLDVWKVEFRLDREASEDWRSADKSDAAFEAGEQWESADESYLKEQNRPTVTFNLVRPIITMVAGQELQAREDVIAYSREEGDAQVSQVATAALDYVRDQCDAGFQWSEAFRDMLIGGMGWVGSRIDYGVMPEGKLVDERLDPNTMYWDYAAEQRNLIDARRLWQVKVVDIAAARALAPDADDGDFDAAWTQVDLPGRIARETRDQRDYKGKHHDAGPGTKLVRLVERQWYEIESFVKVIDPRDGSELELAASDAEQTGVMGLATGTVERRVYKKALIGAKVLWVEELGTDEFHFQCMTGVRDRAEGRWYGMVRGMRDAQCWVNKWLAQTIHIYNSSGKGGLEFETDAFVNPSKALQDWPKPTAAIEYNSGALQSGKAREKAVGQLPTGFEQFIPVLIDLVRQSAGVNPELLGMSRQAAEDPSGVVEMQRQRAGLTMLAQYFDSMALFRRMHGRLHLGLIKSFMNDQRLIRIVGDTGAQYVPLFLEGDAEQYDIITEGVPTSPSNRERNWKVLQPLLPILAQVGMPPELWVEVAKISPLPAQFAEKVAQVVAKSQPTPEQIKEQEEQKKLQIRAFVAQIMSEEAQAKERQAGAVLDMAKAQETADKVQLQAIQQTVDMIDAAMPTQIDPNRAMDIQSRERLAGQQNDLKRQQGDQQTALKREQGSQQDQTKRLQAALADRQADIAGRRQMAMQAQAAKARPDGGQ